MSLSYLEQYRELGYAVVPRVFGPSEVAELAASDIA